MLKNNYYSQKGCAGYWAFSITTLRLSHRGEGGSRFRCRPTLLFLVSERRTQATQPWRLPPPKLRVSQQCRQPKQGFG